MHAGILWFDNDSSITLIDKINKAVDYYEKKYGKTPDLVLVHPTEMEGNWPKNIIERDRKTITVRAYRPVLPGHIWIGMEDKESK